MHLFNAFYSLFVVEKLASSVKDVKLITINIRKNPHYEGTGLLMAERDFGANVSWHWVEDFSPYPIASLYSSYWTIDGAMSNPTLVLIDSNLLSYIFAVSRFVSVQSE